MTLRRALGVAATDLYHQAWRLMILNVLLGAAVILVVAASVAVRPAILLQDSSQYTIPIGIAYFRFGYTTLWPPLMAASVLAILPILLLFVVFQRYFVAGVAAAGVKG